MYTVIVYLFVNMVENIKIFVNLSVLYDSSYWRFSANIKKVYRSYHRACLHIRKVIGEKWGQDTERMKRGVGLEDFLVREEITIMTVEMTQTTDTSVRESPAASAALRLV